jgi:hypothetical protein
MGAHPRSRYVNSFFNHYHTLYPAVRILHIASLPSFFSHTRTSTRTALFKPITSAVNSDSSPEKRILVHLVSNGGVLSFLDACREYKVKTGNVIPIKAIVLDSGPGKFGRKEAFYAMSQGFPKGVMYYPVAAIIYLIIVAWSISSAVFGTTTIVDKDRDHLNEWDIVDKEAKRLYVYSEEDKAVGWQAVEEHAREAEEKGSEVKAVRFKGSAHVQHMLIHGDEYWKVVKELWGRVE